MVQNIVKQKRRSYGFHSSFSESPLCPNAALNTMTRVYPLSDNEPLFVIARPRGLLPLTDSVSRKHLKDIFHHLGLTKTLKFHAFCRAGASWAFQNGVTLEHMMKHGTRRSDAIWAYFSSFPALESTVSLEFKAVLHS